MKKILAILLVALGLVVCSPEETLEQEYGTYEMVGRYNDCGLVFDEYGQVWEYWQDGVADHVNVRIKMSDNGTPDDIKDDKVLYVEEDSTLEGDASLYWLKGGK